MSRAIVLFLVFLSLFVVPVSAGVYLSPTNITDNHINDYDITTSPTAPPDDTTAWYYLDYPYISTGEYTISRYIAGGTTTTSTSYLQVLNYDSGSYDTWNTSTTGTPSHPSRWVNVSAPTDTKYYPLRIRSNQYEALGTDASVSLKELRVYDDNDLIPPKDCYTTTPTANLSGWYRLDGINSSGLYDYTEHGNDSTEDITVGTTWELVYENTFNATEHKKWMLNSTGFEIKTSNAPNPAYAKVTYQAPSLNGGVETDLHSESTASTTYVQYSYTETIETDNNENLTIRFYQKAAAGAWDAYIKNKTCVAHRSIPLYPIEEHGIAYDAGQIDQAASFDGIDDYVRVEPTSINDNMNITVSAWVYLNTLNTKVGVVVGKDYHSHLWIDSDGSVIYGAWTDVGNEEYSTVADLVSTGFWVQVVNVIESGNRALCYVNGQPVANHSLSGNFSATTYFDIGRHANVELNYLDGKIDDVRIYDISLNEGEIKNIYNERTVSPLDDSTENYIFPPLLHSTELSWQNTSAPQYKYQVATDSLFNIISTSGYTNDTSVDIDLSADTYYWRVYPYSANYTAGTASSTWIFTVSEIQNAGVATAIDGIVYTMNDDGNNVVLSDVIVSIYNTTWSDQMSTGTNGYYLFDFLAPDVVYTVQASKTDYSTSDPHYITTIANTTVTSNIIMQLAYDTSPYYVPHYVRFVITSFMHDLYSDVTVDVYKGSEATGSAFLSSTTGNDGAVGFELDQNQKYTLKLTSVEYGIDTTYTVTPTDTEYTVYVTLWDETERDRDNVLYGVHSDIINLTHAYINVTWEDETVTTTLAELWINNSNQTMLYYTNSTNDNGTFSHVVPATNETYIVAFKLQATGLIDDYERMDIVKFLQGVADAFDLEFNEQWQYSLLAALSIILVATIFGAANAHIGAMAVSLTGLFHVFITGWFPNNIIIVLMMLFGVVVSFGFYMRKSEGIR